jgi:hypothetical protein
MRKNPEFAHWVQKQGGIEVVHQKVFELRDKKSTEIKNELGIPLPVRKVRDLRVDAVKHMTRQELEKDPHVTADQLWERWRKLKRIRGMRKKGYVEQIRGYYDYFDEVKKELTEATS